MRRQCHDIQTHPTRFHADLGPCGSGSVERLGRGFPKAKVLVRLDGGFAGPEMFEFLEAQRVDYVVAMAENAVLKRIAEPLMKKVRRMPGKVFAGDPVRAVTWGGQWLDSIKEVTNQQSAIDVAWFAFRSGSSEILALTSAVWPKTPFDLTASWAPHFVKMHKSEWLEEITPDEVPNLADIPDSMLVTPDEVTPTFPTRCWFTATSRSACTVFRIASPGSTGAIARIWSTSR